MDIERGAKPGDIPELIKLHRYGEELLEGNRSQFLMDPMIITDEQLEDDFNEWLENPEIGFFVAKENGKLAGFVLAMIIEEPDDLINVPYVSINELAVSKEFQGSGVGTTLMKRVEEWALENDINIVQLNVWEFNRKAKTLYEKLGFKTIQCQMEKILSKR
ncbi:MAG TPA: GNAT family N-acetyltransferase [Caldisericia bacterium]|nr:GNAT family N-acetyltransferase [Caldisericia bacterium]HOU08100.1 GNAT family N-acetyltransferase [Caldisericia bacterium]HPL89310.1 GNAT family N-acetyltransferase [Caldisericia bacterium]HQG59518.1 GNAT family N-acetyltransferase [Caldisericia bacterium]HQH48913.1 GNAT family N-acetyltransferase [Caldisericia bacterium]